VDGRRPQQRPHGQRDQHAPLALVSSHRRGLTEYGASLLAVQERRVEVTNPYRMRIAEGSGR